MSHQVLLQLIDIERCLFDRMIHAIEKRSREGYRKQELSALRGPGNGLLSQVLRHSTIGAKAFDGRVRDGIGSDRSAKVTRPAKGGKEANWFHDRLILPSTRVAARRWTSVNESVQANRAISTGKLHTLLCFHTRPINVVVFHGSRGRTRLEAGFPLRCLQRLSVPYIATLHRGWRHDRSTRGTFTPVLSY